MLFLKVKLGLDFNNFSNCKDWLATQSPDFLIGAECGDAEC